jgi:two-component system sensor histidine kinase KdpD
VDRGELRIYLGAAPGVGKTFAMLDEGHRRADRGTDVVVGAIETHGRHGIDTQLQGLEVVGAAADPDALSSGSVSLDFDAVVARRPQVVLVDELAHVDLEGGGPDGDGVPRWTMVGRLLDQGIHVVTTLDIGEIASLGEVVEQITGIARRSMVPDRLVRGADQIQLVDQTPEALRRRLVHGNIFRASELEPDLALVFRPDRLAALRELSLRAPSVRASR